MTAPLSTGQPLKVHSPPLPEPPKLRLRDQFRRWLVSRNYRPATVECYARPFARGDDDDLQPRGDADRAADQKPVGSLTISVPTKQQTGKQKEQNVNTPAPAKNTALAVQKPRALEVMASRLNVEPAKMLDTLKATVFKNASNEELLALVVVSNEYQLNPFLKEIYAFPAKGGGICPVVSVDGWNKMLIRQEAFDGIEFEMVDDESGQPYSCTATISVKGRTKPVKITEYFSECARNTDPWKTMPRRMLRHKALIQGARVAFGFSGVVDEDEAASIAVDAVVLSGPPPKQIAVAPPTDDAPPSGKVRTPQDDLETLVIENGFTFDHVQKWGLESGNIENADSYTGFIDIPKDVCRRLLRSTTGFLAGLKAIAAVEGGDK